MSKQYDEYLDKHINAVLKAGKWIACHPSVVPEFDIDTIQMFLSNIGRHDVSKYSKDEYDAYDNYFYGTKDEKPSIMLGYIIFTTIRIIGNTGC